MFTIPADYCKGQTCCKNGTICRVSSTEGYECECPDGLYGSNCQFIAQCAPQPCQNGGTCNVSVCAAFDNIIVATKVYCIRRTIKVTTVVPVQEATLAETVRWRL